MTRNQSNLLRAKLAHALSLIREAYGDIMDIEEAENAPALKVKSTKVPITIEK